MTRLTKTYQHHFKQTLALSALALAIPWQVGQAATLNVDMTADNGAATACTAAAGDCSLRGAISIAANGDTINVPAGTYTLVDANGALPSITVGLTIQGAGASTTIIEGGTGWTNKRIFSITGAAAVTINDVTLQKANYSGALGGFGGGIYSAPPLTLNRVKLLNNNSNALQGAGVFTDNNLTIADSTIDGNTGGGCAVRSGGALFTATNTVISNNYATAGIGGGGGCSWSANLTNTQFLNNTATQDGGGLNVQGNVTLNNVQFQNNQTAGNGGGLYVNGSATINNSTFTNNHCTIAGGAIWASTNVTVTSSTFTGNQATGTGGAIFTNGSITLTSSTFTSNQAADDGGIRGGTTVTDTGSTFANNVATTGNGGGVGVNGGVTLTNTQLIGNSAANTGGGILIWFTGGSITSSLQNVLLANNSAGGNGAAVYTYYPTNILHTTIANQSLNSKEAIYVTNGAAVTVKNTIVTNHATGIFLNAGTVTEDYNLFFSNTANLGGSITSGGNSLTGNPLFFNPAANDYHLTVSSAAIDKGVSGLGVTTDFEGETRPYGSAPDIGYDEAVGYNLTLATDGTGTGTVSSSGTYTGISCGANCLTYLSFTTVTLTATATNGSSFAGWNCTPAFTSGNSLTAHTTCTATFNAPIPIVHYHLSVQTAGTGTGNVTGAGSYPAGTTVTLVVTPDTGSMFAGWSSGCSNNMTLTADTTCTATFNLGAAVPVTPGTPPLPDQLGLLLRLDGTGRGKVTTDTGLSCQSSDCQTATDGTLTCNSQTCSQTVKTVSIVTLTPQADTGSYFSSWGGNEDCVDGQLLMNEGKLCVAYFRLENHPLTVVIQGQGNVTATNTDLTCPNTCTANYPYGTAVTLQTQPAAGWQFQAFSGDCSSTGQVVMTSTKNCGATFIPDPATYDDDLDHISSAIEDAAPNQGDGNGDGIRDSQQNNVASFTDAVNGIYLTLQVDKTCSITNVYGELPSKYPGLNQHYQLPQGLTYFELTCAQTPVVIYSHGLSQVRRNLIFQKFGPSVPGDPNTIGWYKFPATFAVVKIGGLPVLTTTYTLTDGQLGDSTGIDGHIVDPGGIMLK